MSDRGVYRGPWVGSGWAYAQSDQLYHRLGGWNGKLAACSGIWPTGKFDPDPPRELRCEKCERSPES